MSTDNEVPVGSEPADAEKKASLSDHIGALRRMLVISAIAVVICFVVFLYVLCDPLVTFILKPVVGRGIPVVSTAVTDALAMKFKVCLVAALTAAAPVIIGQIWHFVSPALYPHEKRTFALLFVCMLLLFLIGVVFCYAIIFPLTVDLFWEAGYGVAESLWNVKDYFNFVLSFVLPFGLMFEMPVIMYMLARKGLVTQKKAAKARKYVILAIAVLAAILTPPDVVSQVMLMLPMILLYELSVQIIRFAKPAALVE